MRCVNIDWLEVYCLESVDNFPCDPNFFRAHLWEVRERSYGTRQYQQMFTLCDKHGEPFVEIRRAPVAATESGKDSGIFSEYSTHIKLVNRWCYADNAIGIFSEFLAKYDYEVKRLYRLDLCLDFEYFDSGDNPQAFVARYMAGRYEKINQCTLSGYAKDGWGGRQWSSLSWGSKTSMVSTKLYNKTLELLEVKDKPYIRLAWAQAGLVDDYVTLTKRVPDDPSGATYQPQIWRLEFSIRSSAHGWYVAENYEGKKTQQCRKEHKLATYATKLDQIHAFEFLAYHYFHFKKVRKAKQKAWLKANEPQTLTALGLHMVYDDFSPLQSVSVRKDRCEDKVLFYFNFDREPYKLKALGSSIPRSNAMQRLAEKITDYRTRSVDPKVRQACDVILNSLDTLLMRSDLPYEKLDDDKALLQFLMSLRLNNKGERSFEDDLAITKTFIDMYTDIF